MKKLLILILIALLAVLSVYMFVQGISIGPIEILGIKGLDEKSKQLDAKIEQAVKLAEKDYITTYNTITADTKKLATEKKNYEDMTAISNESEIQSANQIEKYENDSLMVKLGNHATKQGAQLKIDYETGSAQGVYNLRFTVTGRYISILDFISAIENDSTLGFKIENFSMNPSSDEILEAKFVCKGIAIEKVNIETQGNNEAIDEGNQTNANSTNTTNSTTNTNTTNSTANTNTTNR